MKIGYFLELKLTNKHVVLLYFWFTINCLYLRKNPIKKILWNIVIAFHKKTLQMPDVQSKPCDRCQMQKSDVVTALLYLAKSTINRRHNI